MKHINFLDGLRAIAALFVLVSHIWYQIWPAVPPPFGYTYRPNGITLVFTSWLYYGHFGVVVFIVLSGFCLMIPVVRGNGTLRGGTWQFLKRRAKRILPPYYFALLLSQLLIYFFIGTKTGTQWDISIPVTKIGLITHILMLQDLISATEINYVFWSVAYEFHLYICFPFLILLWNYFGNYRTTIFVGLFVYSIIAVLEIGRFNVIPSQFIGLSFDFVLGMFGATIVFSRDKLSSYLRTYLPWNVFFVILSFIIILFCYILGFDLAEKTFAFLDFVCALNTLCLIISASNNVKQNIFRDFLSLKPLVFIGTFSYSIYLIHAPILQMIWKYFLYPLQLDDFESFSLLFITGIPLILFLSYLFFLLCERPFMNKI